MPQSQPESRTDELVRQAAEGDDTARDQLLLRYRMRLKRMVEIQLDHRLAARIDPSDVIQDVLAEATRKLPEYLNEPGLPFYPWLRGLAMQRMIDLKRRHIDAHRRSVLREDDREFSLSDNSAWDLARRLLAGDMTASKRLERKEQRARVHTVLSELSPRDQEILVLRYLEELSTEEVAAVLQLSKDAVRSRLRRALERFATLFGDLSGDHA